MHPSNLTLLTLLHACPQVDATGHSWRSGVLVERRKLRQWYFKLTHFAQVCRHFFASSACCLSNRLLVEPNLSTPVLSSLCSNACDFDVPGSAERSGHAQRVSPFLPRLHAGRSCCRHNACPS